MNDASLGSAPPSHPAPFENIFELLRKYFYHHGQLCGALINNAKFTTLLLNTKTKHFTHM